MLERLRKFLGTFPFYFGKAKSRRVFLAYQPDSYVEFKEYPEFDALFERFSKFNRPNNVGDIARLWTFILNLKQIINEGIEGDFAELGVWRGNTAAVLAHFAEKTSRRVVLFDTFSGFDRRDLKGIDKDIGDQFEDTSVSLVKGVVGHGDGVCEFVKGYFPDTVEASHEARTYAAVSLDCDLYEPMKAGLDFFYPRMAKGGLFLLHDYSSRHWPGAKQAVDEFCKDKDERVILMPDKSGSAFIRKSKSPL